MNRRIAHVLAAVMLCSSASAGAAVVDVLVVFEETAFGSTSAGERELDGARIVSTANDALDASGLFPGHSFRLAHVSPSAFNFASTPDTTGFQALLSICAPNGPCDPDITALRTQYATDVVVMVSEYGTDFCGMARVASDMQVRHANRDSYFFVVVRRDCIQVGHPIGHVTAPHELGHLMSLEHQKGTGPFEDANGSAPVTYNHPDKTGTFATLMVTGPEACAPLGNCNVGGYFSDPTRNYPGQTFPRGHAFDRHDARMMNSAFPVIAEYRPLPGPQVTLPPPICTSEPVGCAGGKRRYLVSYYQQDAQPFPVGDADYSSNNGSTWNNLVVGVDACVPVRPASPGFVVRARIQSSWGDSPFCLIYLPAANCSDNNP